jgi:nitric oxide reductase large subunit
MKRFIISIICSIIGLILSSFGLIMGLQSIGASGWEKLGVIFIIPSVIVMLVIIFDFLITLDKIKKGLIYSCINSIIKIGIICCLLLAAISDYKFGTSNLELYIIVIVGLIVITIPSVLNIIKLIKSKKKLL